MPMPVMQIRVMHMLVPQGRMFMPMAVRFRERSLMAMLMVCVMHMHMLMRHRRMFVPMVMPLGQMQPQPCRHQCPRNRQGPCHGLAQHHLRQHRPDKRRKCELRPRSRRAQMPQRKDEQHQT